MQTARSHRCQHRRLRRRLHQCQNQNAGAVGSQHQAQATLVCTQIPTTLGQHQATLVFSQHQTTWVCSQHQATLVCSQHQASLACSQNRPPWSAVFTTQWSRACRAAMQAKSPCNCSDSRQRAATSNNSQSRQQAAASNRTKWGGGGEGGGGYRARSRCNSTRSRGNSIRSRCNKCSWIACRMCRSWTSNKKTKHKN